MDAAGAAYPDHLLFGHVGFHVRQVLANGGVEQVGELVYDRHRTSDAFLVELGEIHAIEQNCSRIGCVLLVQQVVYRALPAAAVSCERNRLPRFHSEADIFEHLPSRLERVAIRRIGERDVLELHLAGHLLQVPIAKALLWEFAADDERAQPATRKPQLAVEVRETHDGEDGLVSEPRVVVVQHDRHGGLHHLLRQQEHHEQHECQVSHVQHRRRGQTVFPALPQRFFLQVVRRLHTAVDLLRYASLEVQ